MKRSAGGLPIENSSAETSGVARTINHKTCVRHNSAGELKGSSPHIIYLLNQLHIGLYYRKLLILIK